MNSHTLRPMVSTDLHTVLSWRNHPSIRASSYGQEIITEQEHKNWFAKADDDPDITLLIYESNGVPLGFTKFKTLNSDKVAEWSFYTAPSAAKGTGYVMGKLALKFAFTELNLHKVCGEVLGFNLRSIAFHKRLEFVEEGLLREHYFDGDSFHDVHCFGLLSKEWSHQFRI